MAVMAAAVVMTAAVVTAGRGMSLCDSCVVGCMCEQEVLALCWLAVAAAASVPVRLLCCP